MEKIKRFLNDFIESEKGKDILVVVIVILVGLGSFELGRLSKNDTGQGIKIEYPGEVQDQQASIISSAEAYSVPSKISKNTSSTATEKNSAAKNFFASSRGKKYYSLGCSAGKTIKQENRVYFISREEAEKAGYELSSSCK